MGEYNPNAPYIIGNEWVPIRTTTYKPNAITEYGYSFKIDHSTAIVSGTYTTVFGQNSTEVAEMLHVYPEGTEDQTGPIHTLTIPVSAFAVTGTGGGFSALPNNPATDGLIFTGGNSLQIGLSFDITSYAQALNGKRILELGFDYLAQGAAVALAGAQVTIGKMGDRFNSPAYKLGLDGLATGATGIQYISASEANPFWQPNGLGPFGTPVQSRIYPWRLQELLNFNAGTVGNDRMIVMFNVNLPDPTFDLFVRYFNMRIWYCEERRILYGGDYLIRSGTSNDYSNGTPKFVQLRDTNLAIPTAVAAGRYTVTHSHTEIGENPGARPVPDMRALRELYQLPSQKGVTVGRTLTIDREFSATSPAVLPQITLHHASGIVTGCHVYGIQDAVPIYGATTAFQEIEDDPAGAVRQYPQARFYARRFGNTTAPLRFIDVATGTFSVGISVAEFDALPEIVDGWKEVTLRFTSPPTFATAAGDIDWRWDAVGETAGNQWQILGAGSISPTGTQAFGPASYYSPVGDTVTLTWQSPLVSGAGNDLLSDATAIFSTDPPAITGFALSTCSQQITGIGMSCGVPAGCIPTGIYGTQVSWTNSTTCDTFSRTVSSQWGTADTGQSWAVTGGAGSDYNVALGVGTHTITGTAVPHQGFITVNRDAQDVKCGPIIVPAVPTGAGIEAGILIRRNTTAGNWYSANLTISTAAITTLSLTRNISGTITSLGSMALPLAHTPGSQYYIRAQAVDSIIKVKAWTAADTEPGWMITVTDTGIPTGTQAGVRSILNTSNTNAPLTISFDNFQAVQADLADGRYEIQRFDSTDNAWSTVFDTSNICVTGFCDFEARTGVASIYRMRTRNVLDFSGPWVSGSATLPSPGIAGTSGTGMLIFTSNKQPLSNLAYVMQFDGKPVETFTFPEADTVSLLRMYGKDFFTAFRPLERGGDKFQRTLLVSAAAIALPSMAGFTNLRDLAWSDLPYVCVRDELGNRWYATVIVPSGGVTRHRTLYFAQIEVVQATNTPYPAIS